MNKIKKIFLFLIIAVFSNSAISQNIDFSKISTRQLIKFAESAERYGDYYTAVDFYQEYIERTKSVDADMVYKVAEYYMFERNYKNAEKYYKEAYNIDSKKYPDALFYMAKMQKMQAEYEKAKRNFIAYVNLHKENNEFAKNVSLANIEAAGCDLELKSNNSTQLLNIENLGSEINKPHVEYSPLFIDDNTIIYGSMKTDSLEFVKTSNLKKRPVRKLYQAKYNNKKWEDLGEFVGPFNQKQKNTGSGTFSSDKTKFYFTYCETSWNSKTLCEIWKSEKSGDTWQEPTKLDNSINKANYTSTYPTIGKNKDGKDVLYFSSDRPNGFGEMDLWYSLPNDNGDYENPINMGEKINTIANEITPFYFNKKNKLFFSSNGIAGYGGYDVFETTQEDSLWTKPKNIGYPLNTSIDELYYSLYEDQKKGLFVSNRTSENSIRNNHCCDDIYYFYYTPNDVYVTGILYKITETSTKLDQDYIDKNRLKNGKVNLYNIEEKTGIRNKIGFVKTNENGEYKFKVSHDKNYMVEMYVFSGGYFNKTVPFSSVDLAPDDSLIIISPVGINVVPKEPIVVNDILYEYGSAILTQKAKSILDNNLLTFLTENKNMLVEISSHTDSVSSDEFNLKLSQARANSVVEYLISHGVERKMLVAKGYGESRPIAPNSNPDGTDNEDGRHKNRRTEFRVLEVLEE